MNRIGSKWPNTSIACLVLLAAMTSPALSSYKGHKDPDWPCIQRKVPEISLGQVWNGPELPQSAKDWQKNAEIAELVQDLAARRVPVAEAQQKIRDFSAGLPEEQRERDLLTLMQGLFDHMNAERSQLISGIGRYARKQVELAAALRKAVSEVDALRTKPDANPNEVTLRTNQLTMKTRIFEERVQSLTYVCEVPTLIEQRLYQLAKTISEVLPKE